MLSPTAATTNNFKLKKGQDIFEECDFEPHGIGRLLYTGIAGGYVLEGYFVKG